ncbi:MAG: lipopolysaccharide biosynthesis protein, partial [Promethearchaeota archaeon]
MKSKKKIVFIFASVLMVSALIPITFSFLTSTTNAQAKIGTRDASALNIAVITCNSSEEYLQGYKVVLNLKEYFNTSYFTPENMSSLKTDFSGTQDKLDVILILDLTNDLNLTLTQMQNISWAVNNGSLGLFFQTNNDNQLYDLQLLDELKVSLPVIPKVDGARPIELEKNLTMSISTKMTGVSDVLLDKVSFISLPLLLNLSIHEKINDGAKVLVEGSVGFTADAPKYPLLAMNFNGKARVIQLNAPLRVNSNENLGNWPYFNYFMYVVLNRLANTSSSSISSFASWRYSPIPQGENQVAILVLLAIFGVITVLLFMYFRRKTSSRPLQLMSLEEFISKMELREKKKMARKMRRKNLFSRGKKVVTPKAREDVEKVEAEGLLNVDEKSWKVPGYHKPLSGFFTMFYITLVVIAPLFVVVIYVLPTFIIQDPSSFGIQFIITSIFSAVFITLDFGLAQAYDRFVGQYWSTEPERALKYIQFFIWYQMLSGLGQTTVISLIGLYIVPSINSIGFMSWFFVVNTLVQFPGIVYVFTHMLKSAQRTDLEALVNFISMIFFQIGLMTVFPEIFRQLGASNPHVGEVIGASLGLSLGSYAGQMAQMLLSAAFLKKIDKRFTIGQLFRMDFDRKLIFETLLFGLKSMLSNVIYLFGNFFSVIIITFNLNNYPYYGSFIGIATYLTYPIYFMTILYENALPTTSEAYNNKKFKLAGTYISYGFKYFGMFALLLFTLFVLPYSINQIVTSVVPGLYKPMGMIIMFYSITKLFLALGDYSKLFLISIDRAGTYVIAVLIEQVTRISFLLIAIKPLQFWAFVFAEIPGALIKIILTWTLTHKKIIRVKINIWQTLVAPGISCLIIAGIGWVLSLFYQSILEVLTPIGGATIYMIMFFVGFGIIL